MVAKAVISPLWQKQRVLPAPGMVTLAALPDAAGRYADVSVVRAVSLSFPCMSEGFQYRLHY